MWQYVYLFVVTSILATIPLILFCYVYLKYVSFNYWKKLKVPHEEPVIPFGNSYPIITGQISIGEFCKQSYEKFKNYRFHGFYSFNKSGLIINDPELIRLILIKEFNKFSDRGLYVNENVDPLSGHLFLLSGERWRQLRAKLSPTFTSGKLKTMFPLLKEVGDELIKATEKMIDSTNVIDVKDLVSRYTIDTISSLAFGYNCNSLENPNNEFQKYARIAINRSPLISVAVIALPFVQDVLRVPLTDPEVIKYFSKTFSEMLNYRRANSIIRNDFMNLLIQLLDKGSLDDNDSSTVPNTSERMKIAEATAQAFVFFVAGFETTSSTVTYILYELAMHPEVQQQLHEEIDRVKADEEDFTYDIILNEMPYLHMVFSETLRLHPSLSFLNRVCNENWKVPDSDFVIPKGQDITLPVSGLHRDPKYFPEPDKFDPERFSKENILKRPPCVYLPFGDGPRMCIGTRFAIIQSKMALISLLSSYTFSVCDKTPIPIKYNRSSVAQTPDGPVYLRLEPRL